MSESKRLDVTRRDDALRKLRVIVVGEKEPVARQTLIMDQGLSWIHNIVVEAAKTAATLADDDAVVAQIDNLLAR